jgi:hypothetical protein
MYKLLLTSTFLLLLFFECRAQIQITLSDMPTADPMYNVYYRMVKTSDFKGVSSGLAGSNIVWDFSTIAGAVLDSSKFVDPATYDTSLAKSFPGSNLAEVSKKEILYYNISDSRGKIQGKLLGRVDSVTKVLTPPLTYIDLPLTYKKYYSGTGVEYIPVSVSLRTRVVITKKDSVDAWGSITTPYKTYDVLRVYSYISMTSYQEEDVQGAWVSQSQSTSYSREYTWWANGVGKYVFKMKFYGVAGDSITEISWHKGKEAIVTSNQTALSPSSVQVGPNPGNGNFQITLNVPYVDGYTMSVSDLIGKEKFSGFITEPGNVYDLSYLPEGMYLLKIIAPDGKSLVKKLSFKK